MSTSGLTFGRLREKRKSAASAKRGPESTVTRRERRSSQAVPAPRLRLASTGTPFRTSRARPSPSKGRAHAREPRRRSVPRGTVPQNILQACPGERAAFPGVRHPASGRSLNARELRQNGGFVRARIGRRVPLLPSALRRHRRRCRARPSEPREPVHGRRPLLREFRVGDAPRVSLAFVLVRRQQRPQLVRGGPR